ncbi:VapE domain-containing protein [Pseudomonas aeruginosa]|uniref:VapE domain-containing protein n=1 Tax=Pseudomonas aeruginosa TaxID=287 RepID=UPI003D2CE210
MRAYLEGLEWDGTPRIEHWLNRALGVEETPYSMKAGKRWLIGAVCACYAPRLQDGYGADPRRVAG